MIRGMVRGGETRPTKVDVARSVGNDFNVNPLFIQIFQILQTRRDH
jgi:hypothetical protein